MTEKQIAIMLVHLYGWALLLIIGAMVSWWITFWAFTTLFLVEAYRVGREVRHGY